MPVRILREQDVQTLIGMPEALEAVELAFNEQGKGTGVNNPRQRVRQPDGTLHMLGGALTGRGYWGFKAYTATREGVRFSISLYECKSGALLTMMEANYLGQVRTGAASGVATKYLARSDAAAMALFGTGFQAEAQLLAVAAISPLQEVRVYSRSEERREDFISRMNQHVSVPLCGVSTPQEAVDGADIITTMTTSSEPVFNGKDISPGTHINAAGSNSAAKAELDHRAVRRADLIFTDDVAQARMESGDLIRAYERNALNWDSVRPLSDLVAGLPVGRSRPDEVTLFESQGIALWDIALAVTVYERARAQNLGQVIEFF